MFSDYAADATVGHTEGFGYECAAGIGGRESSPERVEAKVLNVQKLSVMMERTENVRVRPCVATL